MAWTLAQVVERSVSEGIEEAEATQIVNQRYEELVRRSGFLKATVSLGATDGSTTEFTIPSDVSRVLSVRVVETDGTVVLYPNRIGTEDYYAIVAGNNTANGNCFAEDYDANGAATLVLYPAPDAGTLYASAEKRPEVLADDADELVIPNEFVQGLLDGLKAVVYRELDEDVGSAQAMEASFESTIEKLHDYGEARGVGVGPIAIPMRGVHW